MWNKLEMCPGWSFWLLQGRHDAFPDPDKWLLTAKDAVQLSKKKALMEPHPYA